MSDATPALGHRPVATRRRQRYRTRRARQVAATTLFAIVAFVLVLIGHAAMASVEATWGASVPLVLRTAGTTLALTTGFLKLASYAGKPTSASLVVGVAFTGVGVVEAGRLVALLVAQAGNTDVLLHVAGRASWAAGTVLPALLVLGMALLPGPREARRPGAKRTFVTVSIVAVLLGIVMPWLPTSPGAVSEGSLVARPDTAWTVMVYLFAFPFLWRRPDFAGTVDGRWLAFALYLGFLDQVLAAPFWDGEGIAAGTFDAALKGLTYLIAGTGVVISMTSLARAQDRAMARARAEAAERSRVERALARQAARLAQANEELSQYAYLASHDLQEPLRMVTSYLELIERRYADRLDDTGREFIGFAVDGAKRMKGLTNDLLAYSRAGEDTAPASRSDAEEAFDDAVRNLAVLIDETGADVSRGPLPQVDMPHAHLTQLFQNLIGNALKFRRQDVVPRVRAEAERGEEAWLFSVRDNGIGIDTKYADRVFRVFQRLHRRDAFPGSGIGLALCRKIVERYGGTIRFESQLGKGTDFLFTVPLDGRSRVAEAAAEDPELEQHVSSLIDRARELI